MTNDQVRRQLRRELHLARCADNDHSDERYARDSFKLDEELKLRGAYEYPSTWGNRPTRYAVAKALGLRGAVN